ncbi:MAG TPA: LysM peptidoglycan-binding domain-containing protein [Gammaproteobacteria bacterium]|nr:LysM peptidoglycan-binding domain-containing protein [Gammaproteobacteria bacterium]
MSFMKYTGLSALVLTVAVGCATAPTAEQEGMEETSAEMQEQKAAAREAIDAAKAAMAEAKAAGALWRDTDDIIKKAEEAFADGDYGAARRLAEMARRQAENALEQKQREDARLSDKTDVEMAGDGGGMDQYVVRRGDNLWDISGKDAIYGNPYQWPLIYKANRDKIRDADLIYPGQEFAIDRDFSMGEKNAAVEHAKTRGSWSLGVVEESDRDYLAQ